MLYIFRRILKLDSSITVGQWVYDRISGNWVTLLALFGGAGMTYLTKITEWMQPWGPLGWGVVGIVSALLLATAITIIRLLAAGAARRRAEAEAVKKWASDVDGVNPMDREFRDQRISLADLANPVTKQIVGKRFIGCELIGPTTILLGPGSFRSCGFLSVNLIPIKSNFPVSPVYTLLHCNIIETMFIDMNLLLPIHALPSFEAGFPPKSLPYLSARLRRGLEAGFTG